MKRSDRIALAALLGGTALVLFTTFASPKLLNPYHHDLLTDVAAVALVVFPVISVLATWYLWRVRNDDDRPIKSWLLTMLVIGSMLANAAAIPIAVLSLQFLFNTQPLYPSILTIAGCLLLALSIPVYFAIRIWLERRRLARLRKAGSLRQFPPPSSED